MSSLKIQNICKSYESLSILKNINIEIESGDFLVLVGPSGCGKSTLLNMIAGLDEISSGDIVIDEAVVNRFHPSERDIAMVFQSYALYPNMTVRDNIAFGMKIRKVPKDQQDKAVAEVADMLQIAHLLNRKPGHLSGGQRQRVAMGRALVRDPKIFLFDEPLSNLDAKLRVDMRTEIKKLHQRLQATIVYVTHDQIEAMTLATKIAVMKDGVLQQLGAPRDIYYEPANTFVATFMGSPSMNLVSARIASNDGQLYAQVNSGSGQYALPIAQKLAPRLTPYIGENVTLGIRPEDIVEKDDTTRLSETVVEVSCRVEVVEPTGPDTIAVVQFNDQEVSARCKAVSAVESNTTAEFAINMSHVHFFDSTTQARI
ncbi:ABC transporter ATP-binding protein [Marinomonas communis]|uniref:Carbohydrate ABC transporter ATP-binding protein (CUT1 family) n=1 Tax=Marinomonas communis TaxID=28254 RepID=A0A4R6X215_9GAMM|nr:sn-glycerol-3-phosphate ABC transporter ATP-binding protein UgpC [Marinomonas communis]TDR05883.1 carbohydrate ABC transporter ATP-binding protein (CUT1 family) [Marinomonas communis]